MKILIAHNFYRSSAPSGENKVFQNECELLRKNAHAVVTYERHNDDIRTLPDKAKAFLGALWSSRTYRELRELIEREKPDLAHFHNIWYLVSPSGYYACKDAGIPVVQTLHNFRFFSMNGKSAFSSRAHRSIGTFDQKIDAYIAFSGHSKNALARYSLPERKIFVKPNFAFRCFESKDAPQDYILFSGRVSRGKGVDIVIEAMAALKKAGMARVRLKIAGDGFYKPCADKLIRKRGVGDNIEFLGKVPYLEMPEVVSGAKFAVFASKGLEMFPMVVVEAFAAGRTLVAPDIPAVKNIVRDGQNGILFKAGDGRDLASKIKWLFEHDAERAGMEASARADYEKKFSPEINYRELMEIYEAVLANARSLHWRNPTKLYRSLAALRAKEDKKVLDRAGHGRP